MSSLQWSDDLAINVKVIDAQHKEIIRRLNDVVEAGRAGDISSMRFALFMLQDFLVTHFSCEEELQARAGFPDFTSHRQFHKDFLRTLAELIDGMKLNGPNRDFADELAALAGKWLVSHIKGVDGELGEFIRQEAPELIDFVQGWRLTCFYAVALGSMRLP